MFAGAMFYHLGLDGYMVESLSQACLDVKFYDRTLLNLEAQIQNFIAAIIRYTGIVDCFGVLFSWPIDENSMAWLMQLAS
jgi:hypothetical protein